MIDWFADWPAWKFAVCGLSAFVGFAILVVRIHEDKGLLGSIFYALIAQTLIIFIFNIGFEWADRSAAMDAIDKMELEYKKFEEFMLRYNGGKK